MRGPACVTSVCVDQCSSTLIKSAAEETAALSEIQVLSKGDFVQLLCRDIC